MSRNVIVAKRYAKALFEAAADHKIVAEVEEELKVIVGLFEADDDFRKFLEHPNIDNSKKIGLLQNVLKDNVSDIVFSTLKLIITRGRESILPSLLQYYIAVANESLGQADAIVYSPYALSDKENKAIAKRFGKITGKTIQVENVLDENLLGGLRVRIGDRLYDGSLSGKLANLEKSLQEKAL
jgi:F-type H+-transporting ATPase subunit delta